MRFQHRRAAGRRLAEHLGHEALNDPVVLALPRGGVPVAFEVAAALRAPLDVFVARKVGAPGHPELGIAAIAEGGSVVVDRQALQLLGLSAERLDTLVTRERREMDRRVLRYRGARPFPALEGRDVVLVDDGLATGVTAEAALHALRARNPGRLLLAMPTCAPDTVTRLQPLADRIVCLVTPPEFIAVGHWYEDFSQTTDDEVVDLLEQAGHTGG